MVFGIGFSVAPIGEQPDNLEAIRRAAAYQDCHRHRVTTVLDQLAGEWRADLWLRRGNCGWSTPGSDAAKVVLLGEVLALRWRGPTPPLRVTLGRTGGLFPHRPPP